MKSSLRAGAAILGLVLAAATVLAPSASQASSHRGLVVIGDSVSSKDYYVRTGYRAKTIWWAKLGRRTGLVPASYSERGSGYTHKGKCQTTSFGERVAAHTKELAVAKSIVLAGGVNDWRECNEEGRLVRIAPERRQALIAATLDAVDAVVERDSRVIVTVPWGTYEPIEEYREVITTEIRDLALAHGFQYVDTAHGTLGKGRVHNGTIHPNEKGSQALYRAIYLTSDLHTRYP